MQQLNDITAVKDDVISAGHAAFNHDPVPTRHLERVERQSSAAMLFQPPTSIYTVHSFADISKIHRT